jgi:hypothetical protein
MYDSIPHSNSSVPVRLGKIGLLLFFFLLFHLIIGHYLIYAKNTSSKLQLRIENNLLTISTKNADLKGVLLRLADKTGITIRYPISLDKKVTVNRRSVSLKEALRALLRGLNYAIFYSGSKKKQAVISDVLIIKENKRSNSLNARERRIANQIKSYEKRLESLRNRLSNINENSRRGKNYLRQIKFYEERIESLNRQ